MEEANINLQDKFSSTSLHYAALGRHLAIIQCFIKHGADVNLKDSDNNTALDCAIIVGHLDVVKHF
ncbi:MAG: ankyrin repeat domain-containing protein [Wolbachia sp.]